MALWEAFYIENKRFGLDTLRVPNRFPTPILESNDFLGQSEDIWGVLGPHFWPTLGVPGVRAGLKHIFFSPLKRPPRKPPCNLAHNLGGAHRGHGRSDDRP